MYCGNCGAEIEKDRKYCPNCGCAVEEGDLEDATVNLDEMPTNIEKDSSIKKKKKKWPIILVIIIVLCVAVVGGIFVAKKMKSEKQDDKQIEKVEKKDNSKEDDESQTDKEDAKISTEIYVKAYGELLDGAYRKYGPDVQYFVYDIDRDGVNELILQVGYSQEDYMYNIYTIEEENYKFISQINGAHTGFFEAEDGRKTGGIIQSQSFDNKEMIYKVKLNEDGVTSEVISEREIGAKEDYYSETKPLPGSNVTNKALLEQ